MTRPPAPPSAIGTPAASAAPTTISSYAFGLHRYLQDDLRRGAFARHRQVRAQPHHSYLPSNVVVLLFISTSSTAVLIVRGAGPDRGGADGGIRCWNAGPDSCRASRTYPGLLWRCRT